VPGLVDLLERFRRRWAPPGRVDTPARVREQRHGPAVELRDVFAAVDPVIAEAERLREEARQDASRRRTQATTVAGQLTAEAPARGAQARTEAMASQRARYEDEIDQAQQRARAEADRVRATARQRLPRMVDRVVGEVLAAFEDEVDRAR
jgi:F0F1-type ATP synthase membrane subunit b/b'